jgi:hypothetical protein
LFHLQPKAILRYIECLLAIITFSLIADGGYKTFGGNIDSFANAMAWGIIVFIFTLIFIVVYLLQRACITQMKVITLLELAIDGCLVVYGVISGIAFAVKIDDFDSRFVKKQIASCVFLFFTIIFLIISCILDIKSASQSQAEQSAAASV